MDFLLETYKGLKQLRLVNNHCDFSTAWLNKSRRYYSMIRASGREPSLDTLARLLINLKRHHEVCQASDYPFLTNKAEPLATMTDTVWREIRRRT